MINKRAQTGVSQVILGLLVLFFGIVGLVAAINWSSQGPGSIPGAFDIVTSTIMTVVGPTFDFLLNLDQDENTNFLIVLAFILISIIIVGTLDSINIFGEDKRGNIINFAIGIIVSIIGVRFMPPDIWASLTAPSSAFVATVLVGAPFVALTFVTMKLKFNLARKLLWLFFVMFISYLVFFPERGFSLSNSFMWVYILFLFLAGVMLFFDASVRKFIYKEKEKSDYVDLLGKLDAQKRFEIRERVRKWSKILADGSASKRDISTAKTELTKLRKLYGQNLEEI